MIKAERDRCAELVEKIRQLAWRDASDTDAHNDQREAIREYCDQLIMKLQPITIRSLKGPR